MKRPVLDLGLNAGLCLRFRCSTSHKDLMYFFKILYVQKKNMEVGEAEISKLMQRSVSLSR